MNDYTRQEAYDDFKHNIGRAEHATISMAYHNDWQMYQHYRRAAYAYSTHAILRLRELWKHDDVMMGAWAGLRADWYADALDDLRRIMKYVDVEQDLISKDKRSAIAKQRHGMQEAWTRVRDTASRIKNAHAKNARA